MITLLQEGIEHGFSGLAGEICTACDHLTTCKLRKVQGMPVFFCEEFTCDSETPRADGEEDYALPGTYEHQFTVRKPESARTSYEGLCRSCLNLVTCMHLKPGGGTWVCASYEQLKA